MANTHLFDGPLRVRGNADIEGGLTVDGVTVDADTLAMTDLTASADELNLNDGAVAGTAVASKTLALGANKNVDVLAIAAGGLKIGAGAGTAVDATAAELNTLAAVTAGTVTAGKAIVTTTSKHIDALVVSDGGLALGAGAGTVIAATAAELNKTDGIAVDAGLVVMQSCLFTQTTGAGTYTGTLALPAGARIIDLGVDAQVLWDGDTTSSMVVGDGGSANGFFTATDLKATDLLAGEINNIEHPGGKAGSYIVAEQRNLYTAAARSVIGVVTQVGTGTAGRTRLYCVYAVPAVVGAAVKV